MVFEKYYYRDGKKYGPYLYENKRVGDKIITSYLGKKEDFDRKKHLKLLLFLLIPLILIAAFFVAYSTHEVAFHEVYNTITGNIVSGDISESSVGDSSGASESSDETASSEESVDLNSDSPQQTPSEEPQSETTPPVEESVPVVDEIVPVEEPVEVEPVVVEENSSSEEPVVEEIENVSLSDNLNETDGEVELNETVANESLQNLSEVDETNEEIIENESLNEPISNEPLQNSSESGGLVGLQNFSENETLFNQTIFNESIENVTISNSTSNLTQRIVTKQYSAVIGKPVRWEKKIEFEVSGNESVRNEMNINLPNSAGDISVTKIDAQSGEERDITTEADISGEKQIEEKKVAVSITGNVVAENIGTNEFILKLFNSIANFFNSLFRLTGKVIGGTPSENVSVAITEIVNNNDAIVVEYFTEAPYSEERVLSSGSKEVKVIGPDSPPYGNIMAYSNIEGDISAEKIKLYWYATPEDAITYGYINGTLETSEESLFNESPVNTSIDIIESPEEIIDNTSLAPVVENQTSQEVISPPKKEEKQLEKENKTEDKAQEKEKKSLLTGKVIGDLNGGNLSGEKIKVEVDFVAKDLDSDGFVESIEWIVPHLSNQTYEIVILATSAAHLDSSRNFVSDIFDYIKAQDGNWSEPINNSEYVRVGFERNLTSRNDITLYARANEISEIEVYEKDGSEVIARFENVSEEKVYKVYLNDLVGSQDIFDLKVLGSVEFDWIVDPICVTAPDNESYTVCTYTSNGTFTPPTGVTNVSVLVVAGGGAGGGADAGGGGGGAGGLVYNNSYSINSSSLSVIIGSGGIGNLAGETGTPGGNGQNSSFGTLFAVGGGGGATRNAGGLGGTAGQNGGSGGGGSPGWGSKDNFGGNGTSGQGNNGGQGGTNKNGWGSGGGGGAGANGFFAINGNGGNGGDGTAYSINGTSAYYAGGGGGSTSIYPGYTEGVGGQGGGGAGGSPGVSGLNNSGGGGGGSRHPYAGANGGSGIVIVRYLITQSDTSPNITSVILTSTNFTLNDTNQNLTGSATATDVDNHNISLAYNWYKNDSLNATTLITEGLVSYWPLNNDTLDYWGNNNGTNNGATPTTGKVGNARSFDGSENDINVANSPSISDYSGGVSICLWFNTNSVDVAQSQFGQNGPGFLNFWMSAGVGSTNLRFETNTSQSFNSNLAIYPGTWYFACGIYDTSISDNRAKLYLNGILDNQANLTFDTSRTSPISIGGYDATNYPFNGLIDEVQIFNRSLSASEVSQLYYGSAYGGHTMNASQTTGGDVWKLGAKGGDYIGWSGETNSSSLTILPNTAPNTTLVILNSSAGTNYTNENLQCYANITDNEGGNVSANYTWYKNGVVNLSGQSSLFAQGTLSLVSTLVSGNTTKGENWTCSVLAYDSLLYEDDWNNATQLTILNSLPTVTLTSPANSSLNTNRTPTFQWSASDADGDSLTYDINITAYTTSGDNYVSGDDRYAGSLANTNYTLATDFKYLYDNGYYYKWQVKASDGEYGNWSDYRIINISAIVSLNLLNRTVDFGFKNVSYNLVYEDDTTDDSPTPILIENDGNSKSNVTISSAQLFISLPNASDSYQFKVDNATGFEGAFNWLRSLFNWTNVPITGNLIAISELNYTGANRAEVDLAIHVPTNEPPGERRANITFAASLAE